MRLAGGVFLAALLSLNACSLFKPGPPPTVAVSRDPLGAFRLEGRISVKTETQSFSGGIGWMHRGDDDEILLSTPLGQGVAELRGTRAGVTLTDNEGRQYQAADAETLLEQHLGVRLPVRGLLYWLDARPRPDSPYGVEADSDGRVGALTQDGWRIDYGRYALEGGRWLPGRLFARHGEGVEFRLVVDTWQLP